MEKESEGSYFIKWIKEYRPFETFMKPYITPFLLHLLRFSANKELLSLLPKQGNERKEWIAKVALKEGCFKVALWCLDKLPYNEVGYESIRYPLEYFCQVCNDDGEENAQKNILGRLYSFHKDVPLMPKVAVLAGNLTLLQWMKGREWAFDASVCETAAAHGKLEILKWLTISGCPWDIRVCNAAAAHGHLNILEWAYQQGGNWDENTTAEAAINGHSHILHWLWERGCPWDERTLMYGRGHGNSEILTWLASQKFPPSVQISRPNLASISLDYSNSTLGPANVRGGNSFVFSPEFQRKGR
jgi:hypothetical protein